MINKEDTQLMASIAEAERILAAHGWAPHPQWQRFTNGTLVAGIQPDGNAMHIKDWAKITAAHPLYSEDTPDTPHEAAAWLVAKFTNGAPIEPMADNPLPMASLDDSPEPLGKSLEEPDMAAPSVNINVSPVFNVTGGHATSDAANDANAGASDEAHGEAGGESDTSEEAVDISRIARAESDPTERDDLDASSGGSNDGNGDVVSAAPEPIEAADVPESPPAEAPAEAEPDTVDSGTDAVAEGDEGGAAERSAGGGLQVLADHGQDGAGDSDLPHALDADFEEIGDDSEELGALEDQSADLGAEILKQQAQEQAAQDRYIGLSDFDRKKIVRLDTIRRKALQLRMEALGDWSETELHNQQAQLNRFIRGELGAGPQAQAHFDAVGARLIALSQIDSVRSRKELEVETATEQTINAIDPEAGWPQ